MEKLGAVVGDEIVAACTALGAAGRFSQNGRKNAATELALQGLRKHAARDDEITVPRFAEIAAGRHGVHVVTSRAYGEPIDRFGKRAVETIELLAIEWSHLQLDIDAGAFWTRILLIDRVESRSAQLWTSRIIAGRKETLRVLREQAGASV
jgi:hypothetical protein